MTKTFSNILKGAGITVILLFILVTTATIAYGQNNIMANIKSSDILGKKISEIDLLIPIEIEFINPTSTQITEVITIELDNGTSAPISRFNTGDFSKIQVINNNQQVDLKAGETVKPTKTFYVRFDKDIVLKNEKVIVLKIKSAAGEFSKIRLTIQPADIIQSLSEYYDAKLDNVTKVESLNNILSIYGYSKVSDNDATEDVFVKRSVKLSRGSVFTVSEWSYIGNRFHWKPVPLSLTAIPFKIRPKTTVKNGPSFKSTASTGLTNIGFNLDLGKFQMDRFFAAGKKSNHKFSLGLLAAPSVEELDSTYTLGALAKDAKSKQLFVSTGLSVNYSYNDISFVFIPAGWDFGTSRLGKSWVYDKKRWWGFGIALSPKILATIWNKS